MLELQHGRRQHRELLLVDGARARRPRLGTARDGLGAGRPGGRSGKGCRFARLLLPRRRERACAGPGGRKSADWYTEGWRATHEAHIRNVVTRYKDEPTVAFWELINESFGDGAAVRAFNDQAGALVRSIDGNHLIESGSMPSYAFGGDAGWKTANGSSAVDITSIHEYDGNTIESPWLLNALPLTRELAKPVVVGEFGVKASPSGAGCDYTYAARA